jgi:hypothetical protein
VVVKAEQHRRRAAPAKRQVRVHEPVVSVNDVRSLARDDPAEREHHLRIRRRECVRPVELAVEARHALRGTSQPIDAHPVRVLDAFCPGERGDDDVMAAPYEGARDVFSDTFDAANDGRVELTQQKDPHHRDRTTSL